MFINNYYTSPEMYLSGAPSTTSFWILTSSPFYIIWEVLLAFAR